MPKDRIPVSEPFLGREESAYIRDCLRSGWISSKGAYISRFEREFSSFCGARYGVTTTNGTSALHLALSALGIGRGDEVIMPAFTMISTAYAVLYTGARPVFIDCEYDTGNMDVSQIPRRLNSKTRVLLPVHIYGHPVDMDPVLEIAKEHKIFVVEDAAESHGAEYKGRRCGSMGDIGCFSFYANKILTTGEGGMAVTSKKGLLDRMRSLKDIVHAGRRRFFHLELSYNYRMTNMQAAIGLAQAERLEYVIERKRAIAGLYNKYLRNIEGIVLPVERPWAKNVHWMYTVRVEDSFGISRDKLLSKLRKEGIETREFFIPMHRQPVLKKLGLIDKRRSCPVADYISQRGLYLPSGLTLKADDIRRICDTIRRIRRGRLRI